MGKRIVKFSIKANPTARVIITIHDQKSIFVSEMKYCTNGL